MDSLNERREKPFDILGSETGDESDFPREIFWIEELQGIGELIEEEGGAHFDADGVLDGAEIVDVGFMEMPGAVSNPGHMGR